MSIFTLPSPAHLEDETARGRFFHVYILPEDEGPVDCAFGLASCHDLASVWVSSDAEAKRKGLCLLHANFLFAE